LLNEAILDLYMTINTLLVEVIFGGWLLFTQYLKIVLIKFSNLQREKHLFVELVFAIEKREKWDKKELAFVY